MSRSARGRSKTGIYHVMLRGVNYQQLFEQRGDYQKFILILRDMVSPKNEFKQSLPPRCALFSYCMMPDHVHLLIKEEGECLAEVIKKIASRYAMFYNNKYARNGHLFQDRYESETVNDDAYFLTVLRFIHQNPVKGQLCYRAEDYNWSSWREYVKVINRMTAICAVHIVLSRYSLKYLIEQVNTLLPETIQILEFDRYRGHIPDEKVIDFLRATYHIKHPQDIKQYPKEQRNEILKAGIDFGANKRQLSRLTSFSTYIISLACKNK